MKRKSCKRCKQPLRIERYNSGTKKTTVWWCYNCAIGYDFDLNELVIK